ncbi:hypothetical protein GCM10007276_34230 [Agaricicola taiwanensis]|uniref:Uncharacterized protein n=1 Tax=Agaricicola taiwanensis TaxID=591372 RepID=A0A8J2YMF1_9RHOB|nr:BREX-1 system adenine-specific DNA-methyltransferase PglX [Agaricicola taiwanensis]GGE54305.1 hypothetical protein GCM10007276_34230 [Agaricicola taiwanensis]
MTRRTSLINASADPRYAALEQRVYGVEQTLQGISAQITGLASKWDERGRTQWPTIFSAMGVLLAILVTIGGMAWLPIKQAQERSDRDIAGLRADAVSIATFQDFRATYENDRMLLRQDNDARLKRLEEDLKALRSTAVTAAEAERERGSLQRQLDELRGELKALR